MGKRSKPFAIEEQPYAARELDLSLPEGVDLTPKFDPLNQTKAYNPVTQKQDVVRAFDPYSMIDNGKIRPDKLPFEILKNRLAADELQGKVGIGAAQQAEKDYNYLNTLKDKSYRTLNEMNAIQRLDPYLDPKKPTTVPSAYHQRYEWTIQELKKRGVTDKGSYLKAKQSLEQEGGTALYNLQQLLSAQLKDDKGNPVALKEEDLYGRLSQEAVVENTAKPYAYQMLYEKGWQGFQKPKEQPKSSKEQPPEQAQKHQEFLKNNNNVVQQFTEWKQRNNVDVDVTPLPMRVPNSKTAVISKEAVQKEKAWLEGALLEHQLNKRLSERSDDPFGRQWILEQKLKNLPRGKDDRTFVAKLGDFAKATLQGYDNISDTMAAMGEFLLNPIETMQDQDPEAARLESLIGQKNKVLSSLDAVHRQEFFDKKGVYDALGLQKEHYPIRPSKDNPDHYVIDKEKLNKRDLEKTTVDSFSDLLGYAFDKKLTIAGSALGGIPGAVVGSLGDDVLRNVVGDGVSTGTVNNVAVREALANDVQGLRQNKATNDIWGVEDPAETLLSSGITSTGELLVDLAGTGKAAAQAQQKVAAVAHNLPQAIRKTPVLGQLFNKSVTLGQKASEYAGKSLQTLAQANPKAMEQYQKLAPIVGRAFGGTADAALDGAIHFGIAEMLKNDPTGTTPEKIANAVADGAVFAAAETAVFNALSQGASKAATFLAKKKLDNYGKTTIDKSIYDGIENAAKIQEINDKGIGVLSEHLMAADAIKKASHVVAGAVAEPVQTLAENLRKTGNPLHEYNATAFLGDVVGGMLFGALGVPRRRTPKLDAFGQPMLDKAGNVVMQSQPYTSVADVKAAMDAMAVQEYAQQTSESIQKGVQKELQQTEQYLTNIQQKDESTQGDATQRQQTALQEPVVQSEGAAENPQSEQVQQEQFGSSERPTTVQTQPSTLQHFINQFEGKSDTVQFSSQKLDTTPSIKQQSTHTQDIVEEIKQTTSLHDTLQDPVSLGSNPVDNRSKASQRVAPETTNSVIQDAVSIISQHVQDARANGQNVTDEEIKMYADETADTIAFLQSKGANVAVLPSINVEGDIKYGLFAQRKDRDSNVVASLIALNLPDTLRQTSRNLTDASLLGQKSFHEFNHRFRAAVDADALLPNSLLDASTAQSVKQAETQALQTLVQGSPYIKKLYDAHIASGLDEEQALEELSSLMFENIYANNGNATQYLRNIAAIDKLALQQNTDTASEIAVEPSQMQKLVGRLPNVFKNVVEPLQQYFQAAKAANAIPQDIIEQAQVFQEYYDSALKAVVKREQGDAQQQLQQDVQNTFAAQRQEFEPTPITQEKIDEHNDLLQFASRSFSDIQEDMDHALNLKNMSDMRKIPSFLQQYFGFKTTKEIYDAFLTSTGKFADPATFTQAFVENRTKQLEKAGLEISEEDKKTAERFATKVWVKFQGYEPTNQVNVVLKANVTQEEGEPQVSFAIDIDNNPKRIGGANAKSKINKPAGGYRLKRANYANFLDKLSYIETSLSDNGLISPLSSNPLIAALKNAPVYDIASLTLETSAGWSVQDGKVEGRDTPPNNIDTKTQRYNQIEEAKWDASVYHALPDVATRLLEQGWFLWNHADKGGVTLIDLREHINNPDMLRKGIENMNKMFINYYISNVGKPYTWTKTKRFLGNKEVNLLNYVNYQGTPSSNNVIAVIDQKAIQEAGFDEQATKKLIEELNKTPEPVTDEQGNVLESSKQSFLQELQTYINKEVLQGYAFIPHKNSFHGKPEFLQDYLVKKTQSVIDSLMHIHIDPSFERIKVIDKIDETTGQIKMMKANEKYMRGVVGTNSYPLTRSQLLTLPQFQEYIHNDKLNVYGLEDDGTTISARGFVLNTKKADKILAAFPTLQKVFSDVVVDGGVLNVHDATQDLLTLLGGQEGKSNKTHSHQRTKNGALNFKQAIHRIDDMNTGNFASFLASLSEQGQVSPVYAELKQFLQLMKAANIQWIIPDSALKAKAQYIGTKRVQSTNLYNKEVVLGSKGEIVGEYVNGEIKPLEEFQQTDGYNIIAPDKQPFDSPQHPFVLGLNAGHGLVKIPLTGTEGLQWMDSISPPTKKPVSGGLPAQLLYKGHPLINPNGIGGLNPNPQLQQRLDEAGYGGDNAFQIVTDRIQRHAKQERNRLWNGYTDMLSMIQGTPVLDTSNVIFTLEKLQQSLKAKVEDLSNATIEQDASDYALLSRALTVDTEGNKQLNIPALGALLLMSDTLFENASGKFTTLTGYENSGKDTKFYSLLSKTHEQVASIKGRGALLTLVPDIAKAGLDIARAKHALTKTLAGTPLIVDGKPLNIDVAEYLKNPDGTINQEAAQAVLNKEIDEQTGMYKDNGQGISVGYDMFQKLGLKLGDKVMLTIIPMTDVSDMTPMIITGLSAQKGTITYNKELMLKVQGRDHDMDKASIMLSDATWKTPEGIDTFDLLHDVLTHNQSHKALGKKMLIDAKEMIDKPNKKEQAQYKQMYVPRLLDDERMPHPIKIYVHPLNNQVETEAARKYIATQLWEKYSKQAQKGLLPFDGIDSERGVQQLYDAITNVYEPSQMPVLSPLHPEYGNNARGFYSNGQINTAAASSNYALVNRQAEARNPNFKNDMDLFLKQYFQLSFGKEGAVDIFSNHPYKIDIQDYIAQMFSKDYSNLPAKERKKAAKDYYKKVQASNISKTVEGNTDKSDASSFETLQRLQQTEGSTMQNAALQGLQRYDGMLPIAVKNTLQSHTSKLFQDAFNQQASAQEKELAQSINNQVEVAVNYGLTLFQALDVSTSEADYGKVFDFFKANEMRTSSVHLPIVQRMVRSDNTSAAMLFQRDAAGFPMYTEKKPLELVVKPVLKKHGTVNLAEAGYKVKLYTSPNPDTNFPEKPFAMFEFPDVLTNIFNGYTQERVQQSFPDVRITSHAVHIPLHQVFGGQYNGKDHNIHPLLTNKVGWLQMASNEYVQQATPYTADQTQATNAIIEAFLVQNVGKKNLPVVSSLNFNNAEKQSIFVDVYDSVLRTIAKQKNVPIDNVVGVALANFVSSKGIAKYLIQQGKEQVQNTLHEIDSSQNINTLINQPDEELANQVFVRFLRTQKTANNAVGKFENFVNSLKQTSFLFSHAGTQLYQRYIFKGIIPQFAGKDAHSVVEALSEAVLCKVLDTQYQEQFHKASLQEQPVATFEDGEVQFSSQSIDELLAVAGLNDYTTLLPPSYMTNVLTQEEFVKDWKRLLEPTRMIADTLSNFKMGMGANPFVRPKERFDAALQTFAQEKSYTTENLANPQVLLEFLQSELKSKIGEQAYNNINAGAFAPSTIVAANISASIASLQPRLMQRYEYVINKSIRDNQSKEKIQLGTLKDLYNIWADIQQADILQRRKDNALGLSGKDKELGIKGSVLASMRRMNPGVRGTSKSIAERYTRWYKPEMNTAGFYRIHVSDGQGGVKPVEFENYLLENDIANAAANSYFKQYSPSVQYIEKADLERTKSYELERLLDKRVKDFEEQLKNVPQKDRFAVGKTMKILASTIVQTGIGVQSSIIDGVPVISISTGIAEDPLHPLGQNINVKGDAINEQGSSIDDAARIIRTALVESAIINNSANILSQQPFLYEASKAFVAKLLWQAEQEQHIKAMNEQLKYLQQELVNRGVNGISNEINNKRTYLEKILLLTRLQPTESINVNGEETPNQNYEWAVGYFPQAHQSTAALNAALRTSLVKQQEKQGLPVEYEEIENQIRVINADRIAKDLHQEIGFRKTLESGLSFMGATPSSQLMATAAIATHALPRQVQEELLHNELNIITPVTGDILQEYSKGISKSYLSSVSLALEHLYRADMQQARQELLTQGIDEEPENAFVAEEVYSSMTELRGDQYIWDRVHTKDRLQEIPKGSAVQLSYTLQVPTDSGFEKKQYFTSGYLVGTNNDKLIMFDRKSFSIKLIGQNSIDQIIEGRALPSPFGVMPTGQQNIQQALENAIGSTFVQEQAAKAVQQYLQAKALSSNPNKANEAQKALEEAKQTEAIIGNYLDENTSIEALKEAGAKSLVASSVYLGYLGLSKLVHSAALGLAGGIAGATGHSSVQTALFGLSGLYASDYILNVLGAKSISNILSAYREALNTIGVRGIAANMFSVENPNDKGRQKELQSLPQFTQEELGLRKERSGDKASFLQQNIASLQFLERFTADNTNAVNDFLTVKRLHAQGQVSLQDVENIANGLIPYLEKRYKKRNADAQYYAGLKSTLTKYGYDSVLNKWFDEHGMTLEEAEKLRSHYRTELLRRITFADLIPKSETKSKNLADLISLETLNALGLGSQMTETAKGRSINQLSQLATGQYGNRNILERTGLGRFLSLYSRFRRTANSYYWNDVMRNINIQSFVEDTAQYFPSATFQYGAETGALEGKQGVKSNIKYTHGAPYMGNQDEIIDVEALHEYPYLQSFQKKLRWAGTLGSGLTMFKYGLPLLVAALEDDDNVFASFVRTSPDIVDWFEQVAMKAEQTGIGDSYSKVMAFLTSIGVEMVSQLLEEDALQTKLETKSWTKKEAESYVNNLLAHPSQIAMSFGMGKGLGSATQLFLDAVYGNAMAIAMAKGAIGNGYTDSPDQQHVILKSINRREAQMTNEFLSSLYGVDVFNSMILQPAIEIQGAYSNENKPTKRERETKKKALDIMTEQNPLNLLYKEQQ